MDYSRPLFIIARTTPRSLFMTYLLSNFGATLHTELSKKFGGIQIEMVAYDPDLVVGSDELFVWKVYEKRMGIPFLVCIVLDHCFDYTLEKALEELGNVTSVTVAFVDEYGIERTSPSEVTVYVGDGYSDLQHVVTEYLNKFVYGGVE